MAGVTLLATGVILPWFFGRYREVSEARLGGGKLIGWSAAALVTLTVLFYTYENRRGTLALQSTLALLQERGESLEAKDIYSPTSVPDEVNVAAAPIIAGLFQQPQSSALASGSEATESALAELESALSRPEVRWPLNYGDPNLELPHLNPLHNAAKVLNARASSSLAQGNTDQAAADARALFRIAEIIAASPLLITQLLSASILGRAQSVIEEGLQQGNWSPEQLAEWKTLLRTDKTQGLVQALRLERAAFATLDWRNLSPWFTRGDAPRVFQALSILRPSGWVALDKAYYLESMQEFIDETQSPTGNGIAAIGTADNATLLFRLQHIFSLMTLPALDTVQARISATDAKSAKLQEACTANLSQVSQ